MTTFKARCGHNHVVHLLTDGEERGVTLWKHGPNPEAVMRVTPEMRLEWDASGERSVDHMFAWIARIHDYEAKLEAAHPNQT